ncbi:hypothetical protein VIGAN_08309900 [Vigna angularis var. angularis]|uniref:Secreted protein n=1 Tax=Vigna angularis var. angularis TaxID=157739 RepID=A0A0S3STL9_PHAAN|nr:hypothetical protein VIGAN_08309900 [Vigna angularis var. angularis]
MWWLSQPRALLIWRWLHAGPSLDVGVACCSSRELSQAGPWRTLDSHPLFPMPSASSSDVAAGSWSFSSLNATAATVSFFFLFFIECPKPKASWKSSEKSALQAKVNIHLFHMCRLLSSKMVGALYPRPSRDQTCCLSQ